ADEGNEDSMPRQETNDSDDRQPSFISTLSEPGSGPENRGSKSGLGSGHHIHPIARGIHLLGDRDGCLHPRPSWLATRRRTRRGSSNGSTSNGAHQGAPDDSS